jgi:hypothetical protein
MGTNVLSNESGSDLRALLRQDRDTVGNGTHIGGRHFRLPRQIRSKRRLIYYIIIVCTTGQVRILACPPGYPDEMLVRS